MKKKIQRLKELKQISSFLKSKGVWDNWSFFIYDPFFLLFTGYFIKKGKKKKVYTLLFKVLSTIKKTTRLSPVYVLKKAIYNSQVFLEIIPILQKKKNKPVRVIFYKSKQYNTRQRVKKGIDLIMDHVKLIHNKNLKLHEKITICILNAFFKQGPVYERVQELYTCIGNINKRKKFYKQRNRFLHGKFKKKNMRKMRNIKKKIKEKKRHKKMYSIYDLSYQLKKN